MKNLPINKGKEKKDSRKRKIAELLMFNDSTIHFVGVPGLEPGKAGPESAVLPLHHTPIEAFRTPLF